MRPSFPAPGPLPDGGGGTLLEASVLLIALISAAASALAFLRSPEQRKHEERATDQEAEGPDAAPRDGLVP